MRAYISPERKARREKAKAVKADNIQLVELLLLENKLELGESIQVLRLIRDEMSIAGQEAIYTGLARRHGNKTFLAKAATI